jgi:Nuclear condensing complex subunits, C-term domain
MTHGMGILSEETVKPEAIISIWTKALKSEEEPEVAAAAAESLAKLMLANVVTEDEILKVLVETYFDPASAQNDPLKQALSYFFPVYCHSVPENQYRMARVYHLPPLLTIDCCFCNSFITPRFRRFGRRRRDGFPFPNCTTTRRLDRSSSSSRSQ